LPSPSPSPTITTTVAGLVVSVGGLSESVVTQSSKALLRWLRACKSARNLRAVAGLALRLVGMFGDAKGDSRIVVPLLKTLEVRACCSLRGFAVV
ncbi:unnamed protein product, partial [Hapterophycus canaliculatus]